MKINFQDFTKTHFKVSNAKKRGNKSIYSQFMSHKISFNRQFLVSINELRITIKCYILKKKSYLKKPILKDYLNIAKSLFKLLHCLSLIIFPLPRTHIKEVCSILQNV